MNQHTRPRVAFWTPILYRAGGTETWHHTLFTNFDCDKVDLVGLGVRSADECDPVMREKIEAYCPVTSGPEALTELARQCDVLVMWGIARPEELLPPIGERPFVVMVSHGDGSSEFTRDVMRLAAPCADLFVAVSGAAVGGIPEARRSDTVVIPNGIDLTRLIARTSREHLRASWGVRPEAKVLGYLGRASEEKNYRALALAVRALPPEWVGVFVGDGLDMPDCKSHAYGITGTRVYFPGICDSADVGSVLNAFDVLLVPSHEEGFGQVIAEAWIAGTPVVSTPVGVALEHAEWTWSIPPDPSGAQMAPQVLWADRPWGRKPLKTITELARIEYGAGQMAERWELLIAQAVRFRNSLSA